MERIDLRAARWRAVIDPQLGGALLELTHDDRPVLRSATSDGLREFGVRAAACYLLVPFANRIDHGRFRVASDTYALQANFPPEPHAIHGIGWRRPWTVIAREPSSVELLLNYAGDTPEQWPFAFEARQRFHLTSGGLEITMFLVNRDLRPWPGGLGLHPYFPAWDGQTLQFEAAGAWENGPDQLPLRPVSGPAWQFAEPRRVAGLDLDHDFCPWGGWARIGGGPAGTIRITASEAFPVLRVFTPVGRDFIAVEPVSHTADAVNRAARGAVGYRIISPGEAISGTVSIEIEGTA